MREERPVKIEEGRKRRSLKEKFHEKEEKIKKMENMMRKMRKIRERGKAVEQIWWKGCQIIPANINERRY